MKALICGVGGQDGTYLAKLLLSKGYEVWGTSRDAQAGTFNNLEKLGIRKQVNLLSMAPNDFGSVFNTLKHCAPNEVYFLAGQSSVGLSFEQPAETLESNTISIVNLLEVFRLLGKPIKLYHASSSECFGEVQGQPANEQTPFSPRSPYAVAKASAHWLVSNYREAYGLFACNGILFNHESPLRPERFVTQKIVQAAKRIKKGSSEKLLLGRLDISRDWGWAPEYVEAMWRMLQLKKPEDFIVATGKTCTLESYVSHAFSVLGLNWQDHVIQDHSLFRPTDILLNRADPSKAREKLGWVAEKTAHEVIDAMMAACG